MAKSSGYLRDYRARRRSNKGRRLGRALSASEAADVDSLLQRGYSRARAVAETRAVNELINLQMAVMRGDFSRLNPRGKAPRGFGAEWAARKQIARDLARARDRGGQASVLHSRYRGTRSGRRDDTRRQEFITYYAGF